KIVANTEPDSAVTVEVIREGKRKTFEVTIERLKEEGEPRVARADPLGLQVQDITPDIAQNMQLEDTDGVLVSDVSPGGAAAEAGLRRGDVISEVNRQSVDSVTDYQQAIRGLKKGSTVLFLVRRGGSTIYIAAKVG
ncbi:MAG: PDZ domain-containing protein, partial [Nitrospinaceae bacterium]|nr:PDZ domain-containing protein [Nitrospinaceae bacterium]NIR57447.1 PDZ domain-containing protein [Nitrospinaceae bacterium]NIS87914.1 PDZ domain-containing protein [Nitrospinaceae bacterium]NIT84783.1 PDZ domain-containing protein [Nitrospinaceae bacterium]NIU46957.1 PDZ domain-containing protein [Nitrospinaceae bacterium]